MEKEFTLESVIDVLEKNGFQVQSALEEKKKSVRNTGNRAVEAIFVKIVPKPKG